MGGKSSKRSVSSRYASYGSTSNSWGYPQSSFPQPPVSQPQPYASPSPYQGYPDPPLNAKRKLERKYSRIDDDYKNLEQVMLHLKTIVQILVHLVT